MFLETVIISNCSWQRVPSGWSRTAECMLGKCCIGEWFG